MMPHDPEHDPQHEELLQAVLTGDLDQDSPAAECLQVCLVCRERLDALQATISSLQAAGREQRSVLSESLTPGTSSEEHDVMHLVRAGLRERKASTSRRLWPWFALAAALLTVGVFSWSHFDGDASVQRPHDRTLHNGEVWPRGDDVKDLALFQWPGDPRETYDLYLLESGNLFETWDVIHCEGNSYPVTPEYVDRMRASGSSWEWRCERTSPLQPGSASAAISETFHFTFSQ